MNWLLFSRLAVVNGFCLMLFVLAAIKGVVMDVVTKDTSGISIGIAVLFVFALGVSLKLGWFISQELNTANKAGGIMLSRGVFESVQRRLTARLATINEIGSWLVMLGLIGTVLGFIEALANVKVDDVVDSDATVKMIVQMVHGMDVALYTTLVGSVFYIWLRANYRVLANGATKLVSQLEQRHPKL